MRRLHILTAALLALLVLLGGVYVWQKRQAEKVLPVPRENPAPDTPPTQQDLSTRYPQHIVPIAGTDEVWYQIPELGVKILVSKVVAEELVYRAYSSSGFVSVDQSTGNGGETKEIKTVIFSQKKVLAYNNACETEQCKVDETIFIIQKVSGVYGEETSAFGANFLKQFNGFYLITGGSSQATRFANDEAEKRFNTNIGSTLPVVPSVKEIKIESL